MKYCTGQNIRERKLLSMRFRGTSSRSQYEVSSNALHLKEQRDEAMAKAKEEELHVALFCSCARATPFARTFPPLACQHCRLPYIGAYIKFK